MEEKRESLYMRLDILRHGGLIAESVVNNCKKTVAMIFEEKPDFDMEKMEVFTTHLAMAMQRILNGTIEAPLDKEVLEELETAEMYRRAEKFAVKMRAAWDIVVPKVEQEYLLIHLCNLFT